MSNTNVSLAEFQEMLSKHDWFYHHSDDHRAYMKGRKADQEIRNLINSGSEYQKAYEDFAIEVAREIRVNNQNARR
jgi:hypothetical protein